MDIHNYTRETIGAVTVVHSHQGYAFMVNTSKELHPDDWDAAVQRSFSKGWELTSDSPDETAGQWEFYFLSPVPEAA